MHCDLGGGHLFNYLRERAESHRKLRDEYLRNMENNCSMENISYIVPPSCSTKNPQPGEARRWLQQVNKFQINTFFNSVHLVQHSLKKLSYYCCCLDGFLIRVDTLLLLPQYFC